MILLVSDLAAVLCLSLTDCIAVYAGYFDESGTPDEGEAVVVGGYIASVGQWIAFESEWKDALTEFGVSLFHMRDFAHSLREFEGWKRDEARRRAFIARLVSILRKNVRRGITTSVILKDYRRINEKYMFREFIGNPYPLAAMSCVGTVQKWYKERGYTGQMALVFERGAKHSGEFLDRVTPLTPHSISFADKTGFTAFQAADLTAWEANKFCTNIERRTAKRFRNSFAALYSIPNDMDIIEYTSLEKISIAHNLPLR